MLAPRLQRIVVGLSGGVDSAVSAYLLKQQGHEVVGVFMKNWEAEPSEDCPAQVDFVDAAAVADVLGIDIEWVNFSSQYKEAVFSLFLQEYQSGRTPNPDVLCNTHIKFKAFLDHAQALGCDAMATGHYARLRKNATTGQVALLKGVDATKDQSYFLHRLNQAQLSRALFPVGELTKMQVRQIAKDIGLPNATKKDSTGICFIGERPFREFLSRYIVNQPGPICNPQGKIIGQHVGLSFYTLGQRQGLGIGGIANHPDRSNSKGRITLLAQSSLEKQVDNKTKKETEYHAPWFVARKDMVTNTLWAVQGHDHPWLLSKELWAQDMHWVSGSSPAQGAALSAKTRYRQSDAACVYSAGETNGQIHLQFTQPQWAVTPGQFAVLYDGEVCLGGGVIEKAQ